MDRELVYLILNLYSYFIFLREYKVDDVFL